MQGANNDSRLIRRLAIRDRRIDRDDHPKDVQWSFRHTQAVNLRTGPQCSRYVFEQIRIDFLPSDPRSFVFLVDAVEEPRGEVPEQSDDALCIFGLPR
jgi:hypothetical protein